jgi:lipid-binding SYLF domain-containing protein
MKTYKLWTAAMVVLGLAGAAGVQAASESPQEAADCAAMFLKTDPDIKTFFDNSAGYVIFPAVTKGAIGIGGAQGGGWVYEKGQVIGQAKLTQVTLGWQLGGQSYSEIIFFETADSLNSFKRGEFAMSAEIGAIAAASGAAAKAKYKQGVAVFTMAKSGLMFEASVGGQKFRFTPIAPAKKP